MQFSGLSVSSDSLAQPPIVSNLFQNLQAKILEKFAVRPLIFIKIFHIFAVWSWGYGPGPVGFGFGFGLGLGLARVRVRVRVGLGLKLVLLCLYMPALQGSALRSGPSADE